MRKIALYLLITWGMTLEAQATSDSPAAFPAGSVLEANFTQYRHLKSIPKPITSQGHIILWDGKGLVWSTFSPFPNSILITKKGLYQLQGNTKTAMVKAGGDNAMLDVMTGIFNLKDQGQVKGFTIEKLSPKEDKWRIRLIPQYGQVQNLISAIGVEGDIHITHITIFRPNGDHDEIDIKEHVINETVSEKIRNYFNE
jgi:hypothetical protein